MLIGKLMNRYLKKVYRRELAKKDNKLYIIQICNTLTLILQLVTQEKNKRKDKEVYKINIKCMLKNRCNNIKIK